MGGSRMRTPKQNSAARRTGWYRYYAGFSPDFVSDALELVDGPQRLHVLDPWLGVGTTSAIAAAKGHSTTGVDINPALVVIAKARLLRSDVAGSLAPLTEDILREAARINGDSSSEPLLAWFGPSSASYFRAIERAIYRVLVDADDDRYPLGLGMDRLSDLAAFFYVALFKTVRKLMCNAHTSNPTWVKGKIRLVERAKPRQDRIDNAFRAAQESLADFIGRGTEVSRSAKVRHDVVLGSSTSLDLQDQSVDAVITSPPYCTRIDYVAGVRPELAVLGWTHDTLKTVRHLSLGNPTVPKGRVSDLTTYPDRVQRVLKNIQRHPSKASKGYYYRYFDTYFSMLQTSIDELHRVVKPRGAAFLVVQDSYYKEIHLDLPRLTVDIAQGAGWTLTERFDFPIGRTMAVVNPKARLYRDDFRALESVLLLKRR